jgi:protein-S-isoprenylcysteine O-methyltransferase Ste14
MTTAEQTAQVVVSTESAAVRPPITLDGLKRAGANLGLATMFFVAAFPTVTSVHAGQLANMVWVAGCVTMGVLSLVRVPPKTSTVTAWTLAASAGMLLTPVLMRPEVPAAGLMAGFGLVFEFAGIAFSQYARIQMGRRFGILPANRGIVTGGPFRLVRHPIYFGWFVLALGFAFSYPSVRNFALITLTLPLMFWRIRQEESLLRSDPEYLAYSKRVTYLVFPALM